MQQIADNRRAGDISENEPDQLLATMGMSDCMSEFLPKIITVFREGYNKEKLVNVSSV